MFGKLLNNLSTIVFVAFLVGCSQASSSQSGQPASPETAKAIPMGKIVIADVSGSPSKKIEQFQPMADYLAGQLTEFGIGVGEVKIAPDLETVAEGLKTGEIDLYFDSPYPAMRVREMSGAQPILRRWRKGQDLYFGVIIIRADSGINSLKDLQGKMIAFEKPVSTSGYFLQLERLLDAGLKMTEKKSTKETVSPNEVGYIFSEDDENTIQWVINKKVAAGGTDGLIFQTVPQESRQAMKVLLQSDKIARQIVLIRPGMKPEQVEQIKSILVNMDKTQQGKKTLDLFEKTSKFDEYPVEADLNKMKVLYDRINSQ